MSPTLDIPRDQWLAYFNDLSRQYQGWNATLEILRQDLGNQQAADGVTFRGMTVDLKGSQAGDIYIEAGSTPESATLHHIDHPTSVRFTEPQPGLEADLQITSADGTQTLLRLRNPASLPQHT